MTDTSSIPPLTAEELAALRREHAGTAYSSPDEDPRERECVSCGSEWPCPVARLVATVGPFNAEELAALRPEHVPMEEPEYADDGWNPPGTICKDCGDPWPCTIARLLALVDQERAYRKEVAQELIEAAQDSIDLRAAIDQRLAQRRAMG